MSTTTTTEHTHLTDEDVRQQPEFRLPWFRVYINNPNHTDESGNWKPQLLGGGRREHCEKVLAAYRKKNFRATQWQAKFVEIDPDKLGMGELKVTFD